MSAIDPITTASLLQEADRILAINERHRLFHAVTNQLVYMGFDLDIYPVANTIIEYLELHQLVPADFDQAINVYEEMHGRWSVSKLFEAFQ